MRPINHNIKPYLIALLILLLSFIFILLNSCNPAKQLQRKEDKSLGIVLGSQRVFPQAGAAWLAIHPCITTNPKPDSIITKIDTLLQEKKVFIPVKSIQYKNKVIDTIIDNISVYSDSTGIFLKNLNPSTNTTKTIIKTIVDQTRVDNLTDSLNASSRTIAAQQGQITELRGIISDQRKEDNKKTWLLIAASVGFGVSLFFNVKSLVTKLPSIGGILKGKKDA